jgi:hypothetical protein
MSKAEEKSLKAYPQKIEWVGNQWDGAPFDVNSKSRAAFKQGYRQAEKDLELTYDDICEIMEIREDVLEMDSYENLYEEILKRFKENRLKD